MQLTYKFKSKLDEDIKYFCLISNNLYNQANYLIKKEFEDNKKWIRYNDLDKLMKVTKNLEGQINYYLLKAQTNQQILKLLDKNWSSYFKALKEFKKNPKKFKAEPKPPSFKKKNSENILIYTNQNCQIKDGFIILSKTLKVYIPQFETYKDRIKDFQQVRILPDKDFYVVEIIYNYSQQNTDFNYEKYGAIDLGVNNLATLVTDGKPIIYSGKICKSINQFYNKATSKLKSIRDNKKKDKETRTWNNKKIRHITNYRNDFINDHFHKVSRHIVNYLIENKIGNLVVGINKGWKDSITLGRINNQNFVLLPHSRLIAYLKYKCQTVGINLIENEESYTSECDGLALEDVKFHEVYLGKRIKRRLFRSSIGRLINADVNGALNILRKVIGDCQYIIDIINSGFLFNPVKVSTI